MEEVKEIYLCDNDLTLKATIREFDELEWTDKFYEADIINISIPFKIEHDKKSELYAYYENLYKTLDSINEQSKKANNVRIIYIFTDSFDRIGFVENFSIDEKSEILKIKGRGALALFDKRFFLENKSYEPKDSEKNYLGEVMCKIINQKDSFKIFEALEEDNKKGKEVYVNVKEGDSIYKRLTDLAETYELGMSTVVDAKKEKIVFKTIETNTIRSAISSDDGNLINNVYKCDIGKYANCCEIVGDSYKDGTKEITIKETVDETNGHGEKFKIYKKSRAKLKDVKDDEKRYREILKAEAKEELSKNKIEESYDIEITDDVEIKVGDKLLVKVDVGYKEISKEIIVNEVRHNYSKGGYSRDVSFGKPIDIAYELKRKIFTND